MSSDAYLDPYREAAGQFGDQFEVTLWASRATQILRFEVFIEMCDMRRRRVLDAGCSRGDFATFLVEHGVEYERYDGVDGVAEVIEFAQARQLPRATFHLGDILRDPALLSTGSPQGICISGTLNTMSFRQVLALLEASWSATEDVLLFNFLSSLARRPAPFQGGPARRHDAQKLLRWAAEKTGAVVYRQDYMKFGHDATIMMSKL